MTGAEEPEEGATTGGEKGTVEATLGVGLGEDAAPDATLATGTKTPPVLLGSAVTEVAVEPEAKEDGPLEDPPAFEPVEPLEDPPAFEPVEPLEEPPVFEPVEPPQPLG